MQHFRLKCDWLISGPVCHTSTTSEKSDTGHARNLFRINEDGSLEHWAVTQIKQQSPKVAQKHKIIPF